MSTPKLTTSELPACHGEVLLVEDDGALRETAAEVLRLAGFKVRTAENGAEALQVLAGASVGAILLDLRMPILDGWEFLRQRAANPVLSDIPVVIVSAEPVDPAAPGDVWLSKPFDETTLIDVAAKAVATGRGQGRSHTEEATPSGPDDRRWPANRARRQG